MGTRIAGRFLRLICLLLMIPMVSAPPSGSMLKKREDTSTLFDILTTTYVNTNLQTVTTVLTSYHTYSTIASSQSSSGCAKPCGFAGQLCCAENEICYTDSNNQAQCGAAPTTPITPCSWKTEIYTTSSSYTTTILETVVLTLTRIETGVETCVRTASWQILPTACITEVGQQPCGSACCLPHQSCQSLGICVDTCSSAPPTPPTGPSCQFSLGESPCGSICCASWQFCESAGQCVAVGGGPAATIVTVTSTGSV